MSAVAKTAPRLRDDLLTLAVKAAALALLALAILALWVSLVDWACRSHDTDRAIFALTFAGAGDSPGAK